jgi:hypothetical protein
MLRGAPLSAEHGSASKPALRLAQEGVEEGELQQLNFSVDRKVNRYLKKGLALKAESKLLAGNERTQKRVRDSREKEGRRQGRKRWRSGRRDDEEDDKEKGRRSK